MSNKEFKLNFPSNTTNSSIIVNNKDSQLRVRYLYEELSEYFTFLYNNHKGSEVSQPNKDLSIRINQILSKNILNLQLKCPFCKNTMMYSSLVNDFHDEKVKEELNNEKKKSFLFEKIIFDFVDLVFNMNEFDIFRSLVDILIRENYSFSHLLLMNYSESIRNKMKSHNENEKDDNDLNINYNIDLSQFNSRLIDFQMKLDDDSARRQKYLTGVYDYYIGKYYFYIKKDIEKGFQHIKKSVTNNYPPSFNFLGYIYMNNTYKNILPDEKQAFQLFQLGSEMGNSDAMTNLGYCYDKGIGCTKNQFTAFDLYLKSAMIGNINAMSNLGYSYRHGEGTDKNPNKAVEWLMKAANKGDASANVNLGFCYQTGFGVEQSYEKAFQLYKTASNSNIPEGLSNVGYCYENGYGVDQSYEKAFEYYYKAAMMNSISSILKIGEFYLNGKGVEKNEVEGKRFFQLAKEKGDSYADYALSFLK